MSGPTLLFDGDTLAFIAAAACQHTEEDEHGFIRPFAHTGEGEAAVANMIGRLTDELRGGGRRIYLSDPEDNWRKDLSPTYKSNRASTPRPLLLNHLKAFLRDRYGAEHWPSLEADDVLGIVATSHEVVAGAKVIVGRDKDFKTIPSLQYQIGDNDDANRPIIREVSGEDADLWHLVQAFAGDHVDGYPGCPGIGMVRAERILADPVVLRPERGVVTRGSRKGQETTKWVPEPTNDRWACIVSHYEKAGLGETEALLTARLARILRAGDYNQAASRIRLWTPFQG